MGANLQCPFCGGRVRIGVADHEGNNHEYHAKEYEAAPYSGLAYGLLHNGDDVPQGIDCPIAEHPEDDGFMGMYTYDTREEAAQAWTKCT